MLPGLGKPKVSRWLPGRMPAESEGWRRRQLGRRVGVLYWGQRGAPVRTVREPGLGQGAVRGPAAGEEPEPDEQRGWVDASRPRAPVRERDGAAADGEAGKPDVRSERPGRTVRGRPVGPPGRLKALAKGNRLQVPMLRQPETEPA